MVDINNPSLCAMGGLGLGGLRCGTHVHSIAPKAQDHAFQLEAGVETHDASS